MKRVVPRQFKVRIEFFRGIGILDLFVGMIGFVIVLLIMRTTITFKLYLAVFIASLFIVLLVDFDDEKGYVSLIYMLRYKFSQKVFLKKRNEVTKTITDNKSFLSKIGEVFKKNNKGIEDIYGIKSITDDFIFFDDKRMAFVIRIDPIFFDFLLPANKDAYEERVYARILKLMNQDDKIQVVKLNMPKNYDAYIKSEKVKEKELIKAYNLGDINDKEIAVRDYVLNERKKFFEKLNKKDIVFEPSYYIVCFGKYDRSLNELSTSILNILSSNKISAKRLNKFETAIFLKANFYPTFDPAEISKCKNMSEIIDWILPKQIKIDTRHVMVDNIYAYNFRIDGLPSEVYDAWGKNICNVKDSKVVFNISPIERNTAIRTMDNSIDELRERVSNNVHASRYIDSKQHLSALLDVLRHLQSSSEMFFAVNIYVTVYDYERTYNESLPNDLKKARNFVSTLRRDTMLHFRELGYIVRNSFVKQIYFLMSSSISYYDYFIKSAIGMYGALIGTSFPFTSQKISEPAGINVGYIENMPAIINFFKRDVKHVNSNVMIIGKSGSGKSYFAKVLLSNLSSENCKIYILDPENEYGEIVENYQGKKINLANSRDGRINPFQIVKVLDDNDNSDDANFSDDVKLCLAQHLQFLESFFAVLFDGLNNDTFELLNNLVKRMYDVPKIQNCNNIDELKETDYPIFDDLYYLIKSERMKAPPGAYSNNLDLLLSYVEKFSTGGRNADLWNGYSKLSTKENMIDFNYQQLLANNNQKIANAQMLLVIHWLNNEIINNKILSTINHTNKRIIVMIDEAHVFIDNKNPIALDFMYNLAKRIRKYNGMQVVITQNIKDFVGDESINRKSTAIINASQYSFVFSLAPDDLNDLCKLYEKAGGINNYEQSIILNNDRGQAFFISSPSERGTLYVKVPKEIEMVFHA